MAAQGGKGQQGLPSLPQVGVGNTSGAWQLRDRRIHLVHALEGVGVGSTLVKRHVAEVLSILGTIVGRAVHAHAVATTRMVSWQEERSLSLASGDLADLVGLVQGIGEPWNLRRCGGPFDNSQQGRARANSAEEA